MAVTLPQDSPYVEARPTDIKKLHRLTLCQKLPYTQPHGAACASARHIGGHRLPPFSLYRAVRDYQLRKRSLPSNKNSSRYNEEQKGDETATILQVRRSEV